MYQIDFSKPCKVYFMGIGGISMSGLAEILLDAGFVVSGSDMKESELTKALESRGVEVHYKQVPENIDASKIDVVVYTAAMHDDHPEMAEVIRQEIPRMPRADLLGQIMRNYKTAIAISGTHGKTSTTSMITEVMMHAGEDPTVSVGGMLDCIHGNLHIGKSDCFVTEACEYTNSFLSFFPTIELVLNVEADHLDFFKDLDDIRNSFNLFMKRLPDSGDGIVVINSEITDWQALTKDVNGKVVTFGLEDSDADYIAMTIEYDELAHPAFTVMKKVDGVYEELVKITLNAPGLHNVKNALACIAALDLYGIKAELIAEGLAKFGNAHRRFEFKGKLGDITIVDDYAHHPQEIDATLAAAKEMKSGKLWCVFQPHTYTRTHFLLDDFAKSLSEADEVVLAPIYAAREKNTIGISSHDVAEKIAVIGTPVHALESFDEIENFLLENCVPGDVIITMGAGDIHKVGERLLGQI